ncbi:MAG: hypothetical protein J1F40_04780 [Prevotellaceae bacterium]|nr:hypothetical protein [Prevotellaceae bacterium]
MRFKNFLSNICAVSLMALSFVACQEYDNGFTVEQVGFVHDFKSIYNEVDETQDWNLAERAKVTVTTSRPSNIKIYAKTNGTYSLAGNYSGVSGTQTLGVDVIEGTTELMVSNGSTVQYTTVGNSVTFDATSTRGIIESNYVKKGDSKIIDEKIYWKWTDHVPEGQDNRGKEIDDFTYVSTGEFTLYPIYWNTSKKNEVYLYYYDESDLQNDVDIDIDIDGNVEIVDDIDGHYKRHIIHIYTIKEAGEELQYATHNTDQWENARTEGNTPWEGKPSTIKTQGIKIKLKAGTIFGIYIKTDDDKTFYSSSALNPYTDKKAGIKDIHACTFEDNGRLYLGFEDELGDESDHGFEDESDASVHDLNDCMFMIEGALPAITVEDGSSWIISAEDLGNTLDIDYNDVVIEIQYTSGEEYAYVTPLAAGGTLASYVFFKEEQIGEIHQLFGAEPAASGSYKQINVDNVRPTKYAHTIPIEVGSSFTLTKSEVGNTEYDNDAAANMGGFQIKVLQRGQTEFDNNKAQVVQNSLNYGTQNVPYVICTPKIWVNTAWKKKGHYRWPRESVPMFADGKIWQSLDAYGTPGHSFAEWVADKTKAKDWYAYPYREDYDGTYTNTCAPGLVTDVTRMENEFEADFGGDNDIDLEDDKWDGWIEEF